MSGDTEVLYAIRDMNKDLKLKPKTELGYNASDDLIQIKKTVDGTEYLRIITDPDVTDQKVDRWVNYGEWNVA